MTNVIKVYLCSCCGHGFTCVYDKDEKAVDLSVWNSAPTGDGLKSIWKRLVYCWVILTTGKPYGDHITLDDATAREFHFDLGQILTGKQTKMEVV